MDSSIIPIIIIAAAIQLLILFLIIRAAIKSATSDILYWLKMYVKSKLTAEDIKQFNREEEIALIGKQYKGGMIEEAEYRRKIKELSNKV